MCTWRSFKYKTMLSEISKIKFFLFYLIHFFCLIYYTSLNLQAPFWIRVERVGTFMSFELMVNIQRFLSFSLMLGLRFLYTFIIIMFIYPFPSYVRAFVIIEYWVLCIIEMIMWLLCLCQHRACITFLISVYWTNNVLLEKEQLI